MQYAVLLVLFSIVLMSFALSFSRLSHRIKNNSEVLCCFSGRNSDRSCLDYPKRERFFFRFELLKTVNKNFASLSYWSGET